MHNVSVSVVACFVVVVMHLSIEFSCLDSVGHLFLASFVQTVRTVCSVT